MYRDFLIKKFREDHPNSNQGREKCFLLLQKLRLFYQTVTFGEHPELISNWEATTIQWARDFTEFFTLSKIRIYLHILLAHSKDIFVALGKGLENFSQQGFEAANARDHHSFFQNSPRGGGKNGDEHTQTILILHPLMRRRAILQLEEQFQEKNEEIS